MQVIISIQQGKVMPSMLLRKLRYDSHKNRLYRAFRELGRSIRTIFLLKYISNPALRRQVHTVTNQMESYNGFSKWLFFGDEGVIKHNDPIEQEKRIKYNDLVANIVMLHNVMDMTRVLRELKQEGYPVGPAILARISPYLTEHIRRFGEYVLDLTQVPEPIIFELPIADEDAS
jgi:TnpA family transposase